MKTASSTPADPRSRPWLGHGGSTADLPAGSCLDAGVAAARRTPAVRLEDLRVAAAEDRFEAELRLGRHAHVLSELAEEAARHPLRERFAVLRMRALYAAGRRSDALDVYEDMRRGLAEELGVDPSAELQQTHLAVLRGELDRPRAHSEPPPGRLLTQLTSFVGREEEMSLLAGLMETSRLVTVVGPGGVGKTRLAVEAATRHPAYRRGRVWFVPLAEVSSPDRLADAVLGALRGFRPPETGHGATRLIERVAELLGADDAVLVLDNCEHLVAAVSVFGDQLLDLLPRLRVLATSRESLAVIGEALCPLGPLDVPAETAEPAEAGGSAAVRLFVDRAAAVQPGFALEESTAGPVADICRRLDGLPLALELAAARLRSMSVSQIAHRLDDRFRLLSSGNRAALPRQRTLLAVIEWSWDLLTDQERVLARRMSIFPGGASGAAIEAVCSDAGLPGEDVFYVLSSLVDKSIVAKTGDRYRMLETIRAYAAGRLRADERGIVAAGFARYFVGLGEEYEPLLRTGAHQLASIAMFDAEYDNLVFALRSAIDGGHADTAWRLLGPLYWYWNVRFDARSDDFVAEVLRFGDALPGHARAAFTAVHLLAGNSGTMPADSALVRSVLEDCARTGAMERCPALVVVAPAGAYLYGFDELAERELQRARQHPEQWARACALLVEAFIRADRGDWEGSATPRERAVREFEQTGERYGQAVSLAAMARAHSVEGEHDKAVAEAERSVTLAAELALEQEIYHRAWLATVRMRGGDLEGARRDVDAARRRASDRGQRHVEIELLLCVADLHRRSGEPEQADAALDRLEALAGELSMPCEVTASRVAPVRMANLLATGAAARARALLPEAVRGAFAVRDVASAAQLLARLLCLEGDPAGAATALGMSQVIRGAFDHGDPELRELTTELVRRLGQAGYDAAYRLGACLPRADALHRLTT
ncbi:ATP-binding protein [Nonomuraea cypriaca]|uniref:ATP-binding protein n=1 Tax=Nonomuraea cypriaca TaxID=1187855 RepID=UPI002E2D2E0C|nr:BTAD domain-containing putative transcriptional regulator [Nonomuraea cypriaca]